MIDKKIKIIFWDFDGVILDSMPIRSLGFREVLKKYDKNIVDKLLEYHNENGGLSRYNKFRYFYNELLSIKCTEADVQELADEFSIIMLKLLTNKDLLIKDSVKYITNNYKNYNFHIVSGSDGTELNKLAINLEIARYFKSISGSPTPKNELVSHILKSQNYNCKDCILIGDSKNDFDAAYSNNIDFYGYNNIDLKSMSKFYINSFDNFNY